MAAMGIHKATYDRVVMNQVELEHMTGFYIPDSADFAIKVGKAVLKDEKRHGVILYIGLAFLLIIDFGISMDLLFSGKVLSDVIAEFVLFVIIICLTLFLFRQISIQMKFMQRLSAGHFKLMNCQIFEIDDQHDVTHGEMVRIVNEAGQICQREFLADTATIRERRIRQDVKCFLVRCKYGKAFFYGLVSEIQLNKE